MTSDDRKRMLDEIVSVSDRLTETARRFDRLRYLAEKPTTSEAFLNLSVAAGRMTEASLQQCGELLEMMFNIDDQKQKGAACA